MSRLDILAAIHHGAANEAALEAMCAGVPMSWLP